MSSTISLLFHTVSLLRTYKDSTKLQTNARNKIQKIYVLLFNNEFYLKTETLLTLYLYIYFYIYLYNSSHIKVLIVVLIAYYLPVKELEGNIQKHITRP